MDTGQFIIALASLLFTVACTMIGGFAKVMEKINKRMEEIEQKFVKKDEEIVGLLFKRMDAVKEGANSTFVRKDVYETERRAQEEKLDLRLKGMIDVLTTKFDGVEKSVTEIKQWMKENFTNHVKTS